MKKLMFLAALLPMLAFAETAPSTARTFTYEVTFPGSVEPQYVRVQEQGEVQLKVAGQTLEYTRVATTVSKSMWQNLVKLGKLPEHDRVVCGAKTCTYSVLGNIQDSNTLSLAVAQVDGFSQTRVHYESQLSQLETLRTATQEVGFAAPTTNMRNTVVAQVLNVGESVVLDPKSAAPGAVKLLKID